MAKVVQAVGEDGVAREYVAIGTDTGQQIFLTKEQFEEERAIQEVCREKGVQFIGSFRGVTEVVRPLLDVGLTEREKQFREAYVNMFNASDAGLLKTEAILGIIKAGDLKNFVDMVAADPGLVTRELPRTNGTLPLHSACAFKGALPILQWLLQQAEIDLEAKSGTGKTPLEYAVKMLNVSGVQELLAKGCKRVISPETAPPYVVNAHIAEENMVALYRIMELLPECRNLWDTRWKLLQGKWIQDRDHEKCVMCMENERDTAVLPCGHWVVCHKCSARLMSDPINSRICVYCRQPVDKVWLSNEERVQEACDSAAR